MLKKVLLAVAVLLAALIIVIALQPDEFLVTRTASFGAPAPTIFSHVNNFHDWEAWSPWAKLDPDAQGRFEGAPEGEGAVFIWSGNEKIGEGRMTLVESRPHERIRIRLDFVRPMVGTSNVEFTFKPQGNGTEVTWTMSGHNNFVGKAMCLVMDIDRTLGHDFELGLANLKAIVQSHAQS
jgi:hypothetical protein